MRWGFATHEGRVRTENEDAYIAEPNVFGVADGMGGHQAGEIASGLASSVLRERLAGGAASLDVVVAAVVEANAAIFQAAHANYEQRGMGTTLTALALLNPTDDEPAHRLAIVNVGDSRTYLHRDGVMTRETVDHSYVQELVATGHITEAEARTHPRRNIVTRALGIEPNVRVDSWVLPLVRGDRFVLCSDGLVDEVPDAEIAEIAAGITDPQRAANELVAMALRHGGRDNVTVVVVDVVEGADVPAGPAPQHPDDTAEHDPPRGVDDVTVARSAAASAVAAGAAFDAGLEADVAALADEIGDHDPAPASADGMADPPADEPADRPTASPAAAKGSAGGSPRVSSGFMTGLAGVVILVLSVVLVFVITRGGDDDDPPATTVVPATTAAPSTTTAPSTTAPEPSTTPVTTAAATTGAPATAAPPASAATP